MPCSTSITNIRLKDKSYNGVHRFRFIIKKDGEVWSGIDSVTLVFEKPDRVTVSSTKTMVAEDADLGIWYYDSVSGDLDQEGYWNIALEVTDGTIVVEYPYEIAFRVNNNP